jgi:hypothetical protein
MRQLRLELTVFTGYTSLNLTVCFERGADINVSVKIANLSRDFQ